MTVYPHPSVVAPPANPGLRRVLALLGMLLAVALVLGAGAGAWFWVERYVLDAEASAATAGDGLPTSRIDDSSPWRSFRHIGEHASGSVEAWIDLDAEEMRFVVAGADVAVEFERGADAAFVETPEGWVAIEDAEAVSRTANLAPTIGPFLLTDLVPPAAVPHASVVSDVERDAVRILEIEIDKERFERADGYAYRRWLAHTGEVDDSPDARTLHVRADGYVVRVDREGGTARWSDLLSSVPLESPLVAARTGGPALPVAPEPEPAP